MNTHINSPKIVAGRTIPRKFLETLVKSGNKVKVRHYRWVTVDCEGEYIEHVTDENRKTFRSISPNGGRTEVEITTPNGETVTGEAICDFSDTYDRNTGIYFAAQRALAKTKAAQEREKQRKIVAHHEYAKRIAFLLDAMARSQDLDIGLEFDPESTLKR